MYDRVWQRGPVARIHELNRWMFACWFVDLVPLLLVHSLHVSANSRRGVGRLMGRLDINDAAAASFFLPTSNF